jgi:hypothetical protein
MILRFYQFMRLDGQGTSDLFFCAEVSSPETGSCETGTWQFFDYAKEY